jgi:hypothetical protein
MNNDYIKWAVKNNDVEIIKLMLKDNRLTNKFTEHVYIGFLIYAIKHNFIEIVKLLAPYFKNANMGPLQQKVYNKFASNNNLPLNKENLYVDPYKHYRNR